MTADRIVIVAGPRMGKSYLAESLRRDGYTVFCGDPLSTVKEPLPNVTYLPEGLDYAGDGGAAAYVSEYWFCGTHAGIKMPARWVCEGHVMARALARYLKLAAGSYARLPAFPCDRVIVLTGEPAVERTAKQRANHDGVMTSWAKIADQLAPISEWRRR